MTFAKLNTTPTRTSPAIAVTIQGIPVISSNADAPAER
jgi:hypothetical protein